MIPSWEDLPVLKGAQRRTRCRPGRPRRPEGAAASCAPAGVCVWAWELSPGRLRGQPRAEDLVKVRGHLWYSASRSKPWAQRPIRKARTTQVKIKHFPHKKTDRIPDGDGLFLLLYVSDLISANPKFDTLESYLISLLLCMNEQLWDRSPPRPNWREMKAAH